MTHVRPLAPSTPPCRHLTGHACWCKALRAPKPPPSCCCSCQIVTTERLHQAADRLMQHA
eukprot:365844-Chlamydomonas_euryale.AAC.1